MLVFDFFAGTGSSTKAFEELHGFDLSKYSLPNKRQVLRNVVDPTVGQLFLEAATRRGTHGEA